LNGKGRCLDTTINFKVEDWSQGNCLEANLEAKGWQLRARSPAPPSMLDRVAGLLVIAAIVVANLASSLVAQTVMNTGNKAMSPFFMI